MRICYHGVLNFKHQQDVQMKTAQKLKREENELSAPEGRDLLSGRLELNINIMGTDWHVWVRTLGKHHISQFPWT